MTPLNKKQILLRQKRLLEMQRLFNLSVTFLVGTLKYAVTLGVIFPIITGNFSIAGMVPAFVIIAAIILAIVIVNRFIK
jgi:hypothetical protein